jgi:hypothetical protein
MPVWDGSSGLVLYEVFSAPSDRVAVHVLYSYGLNKCSL